MERGRRHSYDNLQCREIKNRICNDQECNNFGSPVYKQLKSCGLRLERMKKQ